MMAWKRTDDQMPPEGQQVWAWYRWDSKPVKAYWQNVGDGEIEWQTGSVGTIGVQHWMWLWEMGPEG